MQKIYKLVDDVQSEGCKYPQVIERHREIWIRRMLTPSDLPACSPLPCPCLHLPVTTTAQSPDCINIYIPPRKQHGPSTKSPFLI